MINVPSGAVRRTVIRKVTKTNTKVKTKTATETETKTRRLDFDKAARQTVLTKKERLQLLQMQLLPTALVHIWNGYFA